VMTALTGHIVSHPACRLNREIYGILNSVPYWMKHL
jgi:hypothetical protein